MYPTDRKYTKEHEWIKLDGNVGTIGITEFAQKELGDIVYVELPEKGKQAGRDDVLGTIESVKAVSEIYSPVSGTVTEANEALDEAPEKVNEDPHGEGWYCRIELQDPGELDGLMDAEAYEQLTES
jgi:glycine cleavage system H protein